MRLVYGVGINDADYPVQPRIHGKHTHCPFYRKWKGILERTHCPKHKLKNPAYKDCTIEPSWLKFSNFKKWMEQQDWQNKDLDKDLLIPNNKHYGPDTCLFVPKHINNSILNKSGTAVYKHGGKYIAQCSQSGRRKHIGTYPTREEAVHAYNVFKSNHLRSVAESQPEPVKSALIRHADIYHVSFL